MAADLPETEQPLENDEGFFPEQVRAGGEDEGADPLALRFVKSELCGLHGAEDVLFGAWREIEGDLFFGAAKKERPEAVGQAALRFGVPAPIETALEIGAVAEDAGHGEGHEAPDIEKPVLKGRAGEHEAVFGLEAPGGLSALRAGVLNLLCFVEDHGGPGDAGQGFHAGAQNGVVDDEESGLVADTLRIQFLA